MNSGMMRKAHESGNNFTFETDRHRQTQTQTDRHRETHTHTEADRQKGRQTDRWRQGQRETNGWTERQTQAEQKAGGRQRVAFWVYGFDN